MQFTVMVSDCTTPPTMRTPRLQWPDGAHTDFDYAFLREPIRTAVVAFSGGRRALGPHNDKDGAIRTIQAMRYATFKDRWIGALHRDPGTGQISLIGFRWDQWLGQRVRCQHIFIDEAFRGRGIARELTRYAWRTEPESWQRLPHWANIRLDNVASIALHRKLGYTQGARDRGFVDLVKRRVGPARVVKAPTFVQRASAKQASLQVERARTTRAYQLIKRFQTLALAQNPTQVGEKRKVSS